MGVAHKAFTLRCPARTPSTDCCWGAGVTERADGDSVSDAIGPRVVILRKGYPYPVRRLSSGRDRDVAQTLSRRDELVSRNRKSAPEVG